jgi:hypothetical protein
MYRQTPTAQKADPGIFLRSLVVYFWIAGALFILLYAAFWVLVLLSIV